MEEINLEELENIIYLNDEEGNEIPFEYLDLVELNGQEYVVLLPVSDEEEAEVVILRIEPTENPEEESYVGVTDGDILDEVFAIFKERFADEFNFAE